MSACTRHAGSRGSYGTWGTKKGECTMVVVPVRVKMPNVSSEVAVEERVEVLHFQ